MWFFLWHHFRAPLLATGLGLGLVFWYGFSHGYGGGMGLGAAGRALMVAAALCALEVGLSFDNCIVDATILARMSEAWRRRFLTWGMVIGVFGMRFALPLLVIVVAAGAGDAGQALHLMTGDTAEYQEVLRGAYPFIASLGGMFLLMVFLRFIFDETRTLHWIGWLERPLAKLARVDGAALIVALLALLVVQAVSPEGMRLKLMLWGLAGALLYAIINGAGQLLAHGQESLVGRAGFAAFLYLEMLDASFSFDGVMGAFAVTSDIVVITAGLAAGAFCFRSFTVFIVRRGTLAEMVYLEHGAHYAIGALALIMLCGTQPGVRVPDLVAALFGPALIGLSIFSSARHRRRLAADAGQESTPIPAGEEKG